MDKPGIMDVIKRFGSIEEALLYFDISFDQAFIDEYRLPLIKRFNGYLILKPPTDWFEARRALKNAYCKIQRSRLDKYTRQACRGCTTCQRR
ncbi:nitrogenase-stabilizing/protective protein NifW [Vibrio viridaestus]|uniref:Nitrogenase-stabilizing/protective protein NifW n=1 Tax=Vibrio viridaestus TaxID=2487322 RepID=A0A3N9THA6_9VIBR|nr:nitrogenase-stabilizing/protective protein NifW [Vibrio viridaestus]RQW63688.1 nitrogen fixation protein NifW [Vibrio viridaestus]